jgi:hypothetical protein
MCQGTLRTEWPLGILEPWCGKDKRCELSEAKRSWRILSRSIESASNGSVKNAGHRLWLPGIFP